MFSQLVFTVHRRRKVLNIGGGGVGDQGSDYRGGGQGGGQTFRWL